MLQLFSIFESRGTRIAWLLEELGVPYEYHVHDRGAVTDPAPKAITDVSPSKESPFLVDGETRLVESGVIAEYLVNKYGPKSELAPRNATEELTVKTGLAAAEGNIMCAITQVVAFEVAYKTLPPLVNLIVYLILKEFGRNWAYPTLGRKLQQLDDQLKANGGYYVGGHLTAADIMYWYDLFLLTKFNGLPDWKEKYPNVASWFERCRSRPAFKTAFEKQKAAVQ